MIVIFGTRTCGKVDRVPGLCYVVTKFAHLNYLPLIPTESWIVIEGTESGGGFRGKPIPLSGKSVLAGYARLWCGLAALVASALTAWFATRTLTGESAYGLAAGGAAAVLAALAFWLPKGWWAPQAVLHAALIGLWGTCLATVPAGTTDGLHFGVIVANVALAVYGLTKLMEWARPSRAVELAVELGVDPETAEERYGGHSREAAPTNDELDDEWEERRRRR